jgi:carboxyl-terminal processing protease
MRKHLLALLSAVATIVVGLAVTPPHIVSSEARAQATAADSKQLDRLIAAFERIRENYVNELDQSKLVDAAIQGMIGVLDSHSVYFDATTFRDMQISVSNWVGLGIEAVMENGLLKVISPLDESPAAKAGIRTNDIITDVDDVPVRGLNLYEALEKTHGQVNTRVRLTIMRGGQDKPVELTIVRNSFSYRSIRTRKEGEDIGYIRISSFNEGTQRFGKAIDELSIQMSPDKLRGYVLDLRNNPGGLLDQAISVADAFLEEGEIGSVRGRKLEQIEHFNARPGDIINGKPLIVLINGGTASAAEIVAGALQHHMRATVIGIRSFGRGSVQTILPLGGRSGALRLTTGRYFTPAGHSIDGTGIVPDIEVLQDVSDNPKNDKALNMAYELLRGIKSDPAFPSNRKG